mgnify:FL=1
MSKEKKNISKNNFFLDNIIDILLIQKCTNIKVFDLKDNNYTDIAILCNSNSTAQMNASVRKLQLLAKENNKEFNSEGLNSTWVLIEFGNASVHFFTEEAREYYNLEDLYFDSNLVNQYG